MFTQWVQSEDPDVYTCRLLRHHGGFNMENLTCARVVWHVHTVDSI
jgi:hypothetical protein